MIICIFSKNVLPCYKNLASHGPISGFKSQAIEAQASVRQLPATVYTLFLHQSFLSNEAREQTFLKPLRLKQLTIHLLLFHLHEQIK